MEKWLLYSFITVFIYTIWTIIYEEIVKNHDNCFCIQLKIYMMIGIFAFIYFIYHIQYECKHGKTVKDSIYATSNMAYIYALIIAILSIIANKYIIKAVLNKGNSGHVYSIVNVYIVLVTFISAYLYNTRVGKKDMIGIITILFGSMILSY